MHSGLDVRSEKYEWNGRTAYVQNKVGMCMCSSYGFSGGICPGISERQLSKDVGIPADLKDIVKPEDIPFLAQSAYDDACRPGNPKETSVEDITKLYESLI